MTSFPELRGQGFISLDVETFDPDLKTLGPGYHRNGYIAGVAIGTEAGFRAYYPLKHEGGGNLESKKVLPWLKKQLALPVPKVGANLSYDLGFLSAAGVKVTGPFYDIQNAEPLLDETLRSYSLEALAQRHLKEGKRGKTMVDWIVEHLEVRETQAKNYIYKVPAHIVAPYAISDIDLPLRIFAKQRKQLEQAGLWDLFVMESKLIPMLLAMRQRGVRVDLDRAAALYKAYSARCDTILRKIKKASGVDVEIWAAKSIAQVFDKLKLPYSRTEKTHQPSFRKEFLIHHKHPVAHLIREVRHLDKLKETFIKSAIMEGHHNGRIHCSFNQLRGDGKGTVSGRFSCVAAWTPINTLSGLKAIKDIKVGDLVWTHKKRWRPVTATWIKGHERMFNIHFSNGDVLTSTTDHRLLDSSGKWKTVGELYVSLRQMGKYPREYGSRTPAVQKQRTAERISNCREAEYDLSQCDGSTEPRYARERTQSTEEPALLTRQNWKKEPNVRKVRRPTPSMERSVRGKFARVSNHLAQGSPYSVSPYGAVAQTWDLQIAERLSHSPHRRQQGQQRPQQSGAGYRGRSQDHTCLTAAWRQAVSITSIEVSGSFEVYDITVAEDESYAACGVFSHNSSSPNLQQVPVRGDDANAIRSIFVPEKGQTWHKFDWSQIEYRLMVNDAVHFGFRGAEEVADIYKKDPKADFHQIVADMTGLDRSAAKTVNFGIAYGEGVKKLCRDLNLDMEEGQKLLREYHRRAPFMRPLTNYWMQRAESDPFEIRTLLNRRRQFNKWSIEKNGEFIVLDHRIPGSERAFTYTALNARIQGSAADLLKKAMVQVWESGVLDVLGVPLLTVHDELDFSAPKNAKAALKEVTHIMQTTVQLNVPILVDHKTGKSWGECE